MKRLTYELSGVEIYKLILDGSLKSFPTGFWKRPESKNDAIDITKYLIEEVLCWTDFDIKDKLIFKTFKENKLGGMISNLFKCSVYDTINNAYPNKFKQWELKNVLLNFWNDETAKEALKWLIEEKLEWDNENIKNKLIGTIFEENGLKGLFVNKFNSSTYSAINFLYPDKFKPWELKYAPRRYWNTETSKEAIKWLIEENLELSNTENIDRHLSKCTFCNNQLGGMFHYIFSNSTKKLLLALKS